MQTKYPYPSLFAALVAALGGVLFGYSTAVIAGAQLFIAQVLHLTTLEQGTIVSVLIIGALIGALLGGMIADKLGRKRALFISVVLFFVGGFSLADANDYFSLLVGRFINGLAIGISSFTIPLYISEISPLNKRGVFVSFNQLAVTLGILVAYLISNQYSAQQEWRSMFSFMLLPTVTQFMLIYFLPESPHWLFSVGKRPKAEQVMRHLQLESHSVKEVQVKGSWKDLWAPEMRKPLVVGIGISVFQQITGINTVIYYAPKIFSVEGSSTAQAISMTVWVGVVNFVLTVVALQLIDRIGRRPLALWGLVGMAAALAFLGFGWVPFAGVLFYVASFAISLGPVAWLIISEIYPISIRGRAMGLAAGANWVCNYFVSLTFLPFLETIGLDFTFWLYGAICLIALWFVKTRVPETKGKTFEEIQNFWKGS